MKLSVASIVAFAAAVLAQPRLTNSNYNIKEGEPFTITWDNHEGEVTLTLKNGDSENLQDVTVIASGLTGNSFTWTPENLPSDTYAIEITDGSGVPNYSKQFEYEGTGTATTASASATSSASESASVSSSASASATVSSSITSSESSATASASASSSSESSSFTTSTSATRTRTPPTSTPTNNNENEGQRFSSPLALLLVTVAAVIFFN